MTIINKILSILQDGTYSVLQIAGKIGLDENNIRVYMNRLKTRGLVIESGKDGRNKLFSLKPLSVTEDARKAINAGKRLYGVFVAHFKEFKKVLTPEERLTMNEIAEVFENA